MPFGILSPGVEYPTPHHRPQTAAVTLHSGASDLNP